jgi:basic membrane protein A
MKGIGEAVQGVVSDTVDGGFTNEPYVGTLENEGVGLAPYHDFEGEVPEELNAKIEEYKAAIISGELVIETPNAPVN